MTAGYLLSIAVARDAADPEDQRALTGQLRRALRGLDLDGLTVDGENVPDAREWAVDDTSRDGSQITMIVVALTSPGLLTAVTQLLSKWADSQRCSLQMKINDDSIEYNGRASGRTRKKLDDALERFLDRHAPATDDRADDT